MTKFKRLQIYCYLRLQKLLLDVNLEFIRWNRVQRNLNPLWRITYFWTCECLSVHRGRKILLTKLGICISPIAIVASLFRSGQVLIGGEAEILWIFKDWWCMLCEIRVTGLIADLIHEDQLFEVTQFILRYLSQLSYYHVLPEFQLYSSDRSTKQPCQSNKYHNWISNNV